MIECVDLTSAATSVKGAAMTIKKSHLSDLSHLLSLALRHRPDKLGITLDAEGWVPVPTMLAALRAHATRWAAVEQADLHDVGASSAKKRYEIADGRIRAVYGHSVELEATPPQATPPETLFHGTSPAAAVIISREGLRPMKRQFVHLSGDRDTAVIVGRRKSATPTILTVRALDAHRSGIVFHCANDGTWIARAVPPEFIASA